LIQIPEPHAAPDAFADEHYVGYYHISFDLTNNITDLSSWLLQLQEKLHQQELNLKILLEPMQQIIGDNVYEVAFIADSDGLPLEFIRFLAKINV
ncbi:MAG TPA: VOC family protein, partial [Allocoleopsis sp.]